MPFNSLKYLYFLAIVATIYYLIPYRYRWIFLFVASCYFYASFSTGFLLLLFFLVLVNYLSAVAIERAGVEQRKVVLLVSILAQVGVLSLFKYGSIMAGALPSVLGQQLKWRDYLILPLGLSYIALQSIGYVVDVYNYRQKAEKNIVFLALFFLFFPKITAGPIERSVHLIPQFRENHDFDYARITNGLKLVVWGLFKKILIADTLALMVDPVFNKPHGYAGIDMLFGVIAFTLQIYFDFSGYSDIALGSAQIIGIQLTNNFRNPYFASSVSEFWQRWHISLSAWLRDYVFFPLRRYLVKTRKNQVLSIIVASMVPMLVSGFWHGVGATFIVWGILHGLFITGPALVNYWQKDRSKARSPQWERTMQVIKIVFTLFLVSVAWIFFRAKTLSDALFIISEILHTLKLDVRDIMSFRRPRDVLSEIVLDLPRLQVISLGVFILSTFVVEYLREKSDFLKNLSNRPSLVRWSLYILVITSLMMLGAHGFSQESHFIYFKF
ncbi:MAG TPA: MBOAT family O-acyltransferase [Anaerolineales bacterium]|nr:MBOAT family O-acyltransferase [Anaerolineales bacterium]HLO30495.1 MBOAT family O-acyltransferase [Anaerolineales bacterium]